MRFQFRNFYSEQRGFIDTDSIFWRIESFSECPLFEKERLISKNPSSIHRKWSIAVCYVRKIHHAPNESLAARILHRIKDTLNIHMHTWMKRVCLWLSVFCNDMALLTRFTRAQCCPHKYKRIATHKHEIVCVRMFLCRAHTQHAHMDRAKKSNELTSISTQSTRNHWSRRLCNFAVLLTRHTHKRVYIYIHTYTQTLQRRKT